MIQPLHRSDAHDDDPSADDQRTVNVNFHYNCSVQTLTNARTFEGPLNAAKCANSHKCFTLLHGSTSEPRAWLLPQASIAQQPAADAIRWCRSCSKPPKASSFSGETAFIHIQPKNAAACLSDRRTTHVSSTCLLSFLVSHSTSTSTPTTPLPTRRTVLLTLRMLRPSRRPLVPTRLPVTLTSLPPPPSPSPFTSKTSYSPA